MDHRDTYIALKEAIDERLPLATEGRVPDSLYEPTRYILEGGGKRVRGVLLILACRATGGTTEDALDAATAIEILHNFTLVHDDIMDSAPTRRGRQTVHTKWDEGTAILVGDVMIGLAQLLLMRNPKDRCEDIVCAFTHGIIDVCEGQALDREFEIRSDIDQEEYLRMIGMKTGRLAEVAAGIGGHLGGASPDQIDALCEYARNLGLAFQIQDDLLDLVADEETLGKEIGKDLLEGKRTYLVVRANEADLDTEERALLDRLLERPGLDSSEIGAARDLFERHGILKQAAEAVERYSEAAVTAIEEGLDPSEARDHLVWLCRMLVNRVH